MEMTDGYEIQQSILFETGHGFALGCTRKKLPGRLSLWQFTETDSGRDYYHGRYFDSWECAERAFRKSADDYRYLYKVCEKPGQGGAAFCRYCSTQRPVDIGTYPKPPNNHPLVIVNYDVDRRRPVAGGLLSAWGELVYPCPLTQEQADSYELVPTPEIVC